jgi:hypothetical protein
MAHTHPPKNDRLGETAFGARVLIPIDIPGPEATSLGNLIRWLEPANRP